MEILPGVYETLISQAIEERLHDYMQSDFYILRCYLIIWLRLCLVF